MQRVAIYCRLSDEDRNKFASTDESESIQNQKSMLIKYSLDKNWDIQGIYCDEDYSGSDDNRPEFCKMIEACEKKQIDIVLCKSQSRFSRSMETVEKFLHNKFLIWDVRFIGLVDNIDTQIKGTKKSAQINSLMNEWYVEDVSNNVKRTLMHKKSNGQYTGSFAPYGYAIDPSDKNHLVVDETAANIIRRVFDLYLSGKGYTAIARILNAENIPNPTKYKQETTNYRNLKNETNILYGLWTTSTIAKIIQNEVYIGNLVQHKTENISYKNKKRRIIDKKDWIVVENCHEPIISQEAFKEACKIRGKRTRHSKIEGEINVFSGFLRCGECGSRMNKLSYKGNKNGERYNYYRCFQYPLHLCNNGTISERDLEEIVLEKLNELTKKYLDIEKIELPQSSTDDMKSSFNNQKNEYISKINKLNNNLAKMYDDRLNDIISAEQYKTFSDKISNQIDVLKENIASIDNQLYIINNNIQSVINREKTINKYLNPEKLTRTMLSELINYISIGKKNEDKTRKIQIHWKI